MIRNTIWSARTGAAVFGLGVGLLVTSLGARPARGQFVDLGDFEDRSLVYQAFHLDKPLTLRVECVGASDGDEDADFYARGWILNAATRRVEWALRHANSEPDDSHQNRTFDGTIQLGAGDYIAYYSVFWAGRMREIRIGDQPIIRWFPKWQGRSPRHSRAWRLLVETADAADDAHVRPLQDLPEIGDERTFLKLTDIGDDDFESRGFTLPERMRIEIYCQGEFVDHNDGVVDVGWILDAKTRERVWELAPDNFVHGGGSFKNKVARRTLNLPAGDYVASYSTDGSHSAAEWNAPPPDDPQAWGLVLWAPDAASARRIRPYEDAADAASAVVSLIRQRNGAYAAQGFTLKEQRKLHVYAVGEYDDRLHQFVDRGWIERFGAPELVWEMTHENTRHAGGARINRAADESIDLPAGEYVVYYVTDAGHAYREWMMAPPHDPTHWGIEVTALDPSRQPISVFDPEERLLETGDFVARLVRVGDDEHVEQHFVLDRSTRLQIVAIGEGSHRELFDYGWIEDAGGRTVWRMEPRETRHAGGARKNRRYDGTLTLPKGEYTAHFVTDDSHAWGTFNQPQPNDPELWGITITKVDAK